MTKEFLYNFIKQHKYAVMASVSEDGKPQSACVGIAIKPDLKIFFDTISDSRKYKNLLLNPAISFVIGFENEKTVQLEGTARIPDDKELEELLPLYFEKFPDGKDRKENWENLVYFLVEPKWVRYSDFNESTFAIEELHL